MQITTNRLSIGPLTKADWKDVQEICADFERSPYAQYDYPLPVGEREVKDAVEKWEKSSRFYAVRLTGGEEVIGFVCFHGEAEYDVGFNFKARYQGAGYAYEAMSALMRAMAHRYGISKFTAGLALGNTPSLKLVQRLGFSLDSTETRSFRTDENGTEIICKCGNFSYTL